MSRADKTQTQITYDLFFDDANQHLERLEVAVLCAMRRSDGSFASGAAAFSSEEHVAFRMTYRFSSRDQVERFPIPAPAAQLLR